MTPDPTAYAALGLRPGAELEAVEAAYRELIKRYHPDRLGGDPARAAEINWAYHHIRKAKKLPVHSPPAVRRGRPPAVVPLRAARRRSRAVPLALAIVGALLFVLNAEAIEESLSGIQFAAAEPGGAAPAGGRPGRRTIADISAEPLDADGIDRSVLSAARLAGDGDVERLTSQSRRCHSELRDDPDISRLDRCVAFDEAAVVLTRRIASEESGPFSVPAVTARHLGAARMFSDDYLAIESRLDQIRARVEFTLAPADPVPMSRRQEL